MNWKKIKDPGKLAANLELMFEGDEDAEVAKAAMAAADSIRKLSAALAEFVQDVNQLGGVARDDKGLHAPVADEDWIDLGETYVKACAALGVKPKVVDYETLKEV